MRLLIIISCLLLSSITYAQVSVVAPQISSSTQLLSSGNKNIISTVGELTVLGKAGSEYIGSGFYRSNGFVKSTTDIREIMNGNIAVYPNPTTGKFTLTSNISQGGIVDVYNITGAKIETHNHASLQHINIDISGQAKGLYFVKVSNAEKVWTQRVIVE